MGTITESVDVDVDLHTAYNQWTQFETFPQFMEGVEDVQQITDTQLHWVTKIGPVVREFDAVITEQHPDELVAWKSVNGPQHAGRVSFRKLDDDTTEVTAEMTIDPEGFVENVADKTGVIDARVAGDLKRFKDFIEHRGDETGAWRGTVDHGETESPVGDFDSPMSESVPPLGRYTEGALMDQDDAPIGDDLDQTGLAHGDDELPTSDDVDPENPLPLSEAVPTFDDVPVDAERASLDEERRPYTE